MSTLETYRITKLQVQDACSTLRRMSSEYHKLEVGRRIKLIREAAGMRPSQLADALGITPQKLWNYESGTVRIPPEHAGKLCAETGADFDYIYRGYLKDVEPTLKKALLKASRQS